MCGLVGFVGPAIEGNRLAAARDLMASRGPDSAETWESEEGDVGLGFRRLRILDRSPRADQPMVREGISLVYNGEIYNFRTLRRTLETLGHRFSTSGDTEVVLEAYREWGTDCVRRFEGMFAFAIWDSGRRRLLLARDRLGIKPLYFTRFSDRFVFASQPKAVILLSGRPALVDEAAFAQFLTFLWVPDPDTLFAGVHKLPPGNILLSENGRESTTSYWSPAFHINTALTDDDHCDRLEAAIKGAVSKQLISDVPLGAFLSGGLDSTLLTAMAAPQVDHPLLAVTTGFTGAAQKNEIGGDDLAFSRIAAARIPNLDHHEIVMSAPTADLAVQLTDHFDDPVADPAALAANLICEFSRSRATVMLSGVGAEELFAGYPRHRVVNSFGALISLPWSVRRASSSLAGLIPGGITGRGKEALRHSRKLLTGLGEREPYIGFCAHHTDSSLSRLLGRKVEWDAVINRHEQHLRDASDLSPLQRAQYLDLKTYLPCLNLAYVDRASMAASVEVRVPFLDEEVVECALQLPDHLKRKGALGKVALRRISPKYVASEIIDRPKTGFSAPVRSWMKNLDSSVTKDCLSTKTIQGRGMIASAEVARMQQQLSKGRSDQSLQLWTLVVLELWARRFIDESV